MSLIEFMRMFPDDATAEAWFVKVRWPRGPACPYCGSVNVLNGAKHATMPYRCREKEGRKRFSVRTGTVMQSSNLGYQTWAMAIYVCLTSLKGVSSMKLPTPWSTNRSPTTARRCATACGGMGGGVHPDRIAGWSNFWSCGNWDTGCGDGFVFHDRSDRAMEREAEN